MTGGLRAARRLRPHGVGEVEAAVVALDAASLVVGAAVAALALFQAHGPVRAVLTLVFVTLVPGWAALPDVPDPEWPMVGAIVVAASLAICAAAAVSTLWLRLWGPTALLVVLALASSARSAARLISAARPFVPHRLRS